MEERNKTKHNKMEAAALFPSETIKGSRSREDNLIEKRFSTADFYRCLKKTLEGDLEIRS